METSFRYDRVKRAIEFIAANVERQPSLDDVAKHARMSPHHLQRLFTEWVGISPKTFLQVLTVRELKARLAASVPVPEATDDVGLSSTSRTHDHFVKVEAVTPSEFRSSGDRLSIRFDYCPTVVGEALVAVTGRGICHVGFTLGDRKRAVDRLRADWPLATLMQDADSVRPAADRVFGRIGPASDVQVLVRGTPFQVKVWEALLRIPSGAVSTYGRIAADIGHVGAARAVGSAVGANPIAVLIPCHRVIREEGRIGQYEYGSDIKASLLATEISRRDGL